jgi:hypothetical protein
MRPTRFNQFGDLERCLLRPGNVHSAEGWRTVLESVIARYRDRGLVLCFRGDTAFAKPVREKLMKIGARIVRHGRYVIFQLAEVAVPRAVFAAVLRRIDRLRGSPVAAS